MEGQSKFIKLKWNSSQIKYFISVVSPMNVLNPKIATIFTIEFYKNWEDQ